MEQSNANEYLTLAPANETKDIVKKYEKLWIKFSDLIRSTNNNSEDYDQKCMKIKSDFDKDLSLKKTLELYSMVEVVWSVFHEGNKYFPHVSLDECFCNYKC